MDYADSMSGKPSDKKEGVPWEKQYSFNTKYRSAEVCLLIRVTLEQNFCLFDKSKHKTSSTISWSKVK